MTKPISPLVIIVIQLVLVVEAVTALFTGPLNVAFVAVATLVLIQLTRTATRWIGIVFPRSILAAIVVFIFATIFLGEVADFYERFWWWDIAMHFGSALGFGMVAFLLIYMLFEGDRYAAPPGAMAFLSLCVAVTIGVLWEIFEFAMDELFGFNMQKSGLYDTMGDLIVNTVGGGVGALSGYLFLKGRQMGGVGGVMAEFIHLNRRLFRRRR
ncbi:MAG: putative membrane protein (DUF2238) [Rhodobacteraceae bacterium HLUCCA08]|nr:MAG: putative membrane protein (DUF2238) [Rhodobacteraceae bacterium HLUCCA08]